MMTSWISSLLPTCDQRASVACQILMALLLSIISCWVASHHPSIAIFSPPTDSFVNVSLIGSAINSLVRVILGTTVSISSAILIAAMIFFCKIIPSKLAVRMFLLLSITPPLIWSVSAILISGISWWSPVLVVCFSTVFLLAGLITNLFSQTPTHLLELIAQFRPSKKKQLQYFLLTENLASIVFFIRIALFFAWIPVLSAETFGTLSGLGNVLTLGRQVHNWGIVVGVWGIMLSIALFIDSILQFTVVFMGKRIGQYE